MIDGISKLSWFPRAATALAILSCYGTTILIGLLSLLGVSLALDEGAWAAVISVFAALAAVAIAVSYRRHRVIGPTVVAALGLGLILWVMYGSYSRVVELVGFALLIAATLWDWRAGARRPAAADEVSWVEASDLADRLNRESGPIVVDVRRPDEFRGALGHLRGARNIPLDELQRRISELAGFKEREVTLVCRTQMRSAKAAALLKDAGFGDARVLRGGMDQWNNNGESAGERNRAGDLPPRPGRRPRAPLEGGESRDARSRMGLLSHRAPSLRRGRDRVRYRRLCRWRSLRGADRRGVVCFGLPASHQHDLGPSAHAAPAAAIFHPHRPGAARRRDQLSLPRPSRVQRRKRCPLVHAARRFRHLRVPVLRGATWTTDAPFRETAEAIAVMRDKGLLAVEMEAAALYAFAEARGKSVLSFAHVTNQMGRIEGDFEKGEANGTRDALDVISAAARAWSQVQGLQSRSNDAPLAVSFGEGS